ncbi:MAG: hypothetical protein MI919_41165 [Holophagales bacterium]|nr:hypothetical protein [Holophagales bacterium]
MFGTLVATLLQVVAPTPVDAVEAVIEAFGEHRVVALGERHSVEEAWDFYSALVSDPRFPGLGADVVLEVASSIPQPLLDSVVVQGATPFDRVRAVWRDASNALLQSGDPPGMVRFVALVQRINQELPSERRIRIVAGDPPIDWRSPEAARELQSALSSRDEHYASVVRSSVLSQGRKALVIMGRSHLTRLSPEGSLNVAQRLEQRGAGRVFLVHMLYSRSRILQRTVQGWPRPSIARVDGTSLAGQAPEFLPPVVKKAGGTFASTMDAVLYLGPRSELTDEAPIPFDAAHEKELQRRRALVSPRGPGSGSGSP